MEINKQEITTAEEYVDFVRKFATLLDKQMRRYEDDLTDQNLINLSRQMPALISAVNTMGYLRGQDGMFLDFRPMTNNQHEFYALEDGFESRLSALVDHVMNSSQKDFYLERLDSYYVKVRSKQKPTVW